MINFIRKIKNRIFKTKKGDESGDLINLTEKEKNQFRLVLQFYFGYVHKYIFSIITAFGFMLLMTAMTSLIAYLIGPMINKVFVSKDRAMLVQLCFGIIVVYFVKCLSTFLHDILMSVTCLRIGRDIRSKLFDKLIHLPLSTINKVQSGTFLTLFNNDVEAIVGNVKFLFVTSISSFFTVIGLVGVVFYNDWFLATLAFIMYPLTFVPLQKMRKKLKQSAQQGRALNQDLITKMNDFNIGLKTIKSYNAENNETHKMTKLLIKIIKNSIKMAIREFIGSPAMEFATGLSIALILFIGGSRIISGACEIGNFFSFLAALIMVHRPARSLSGLGIKLQIFFVSFERIDEFINKAEVENTYKGLKPDISKPNIAFKNVNFDYKVSTKDKDGNDVESNIVLHDINIEIKPYEHVAFVGLTGSGKSTLVNLLMRLYQYEEGEISINGTNINKMSLHHLRKNISYVGQDNFLFEDTLKNNVLYGMKRKVSDQELQRVLDFAQVDFIHKLPNGLEENVGYSGMKLSGGQKQRVAIARALLKDAPIMIFDEATSALDVLTEEKIHQAIDTQLNKKTIILIAHRLSTVVNCDKIYVMDKGRIVESGNHKELLKKGGLYKQMWESFSNSVEEEKK